MDENRYIRSQFQHHIQPPFVYSVIQRPEFCQARVAFNYCCDSLTVSATIYRLWRYIYYESQKEQLGRNLFIEVWFGVESAADMGTIAWFR